MEANHIFLKERAMSMWSQAEIYQRVSAVLVDALNVEYEEIKPTAMLQGELGAESIDFLDIIFRLEREFRIKLSRGEIFPETGFLADPDYAQHGKLTPWGLEELRKRMPFANFNKFEKNPEISAIRDLWTVEYVTKCVESKLCPVTEPVYQSTGMEQA